jgi:hypothetical protein
MEEKMLTKSHGIGESIKEYKVNDYIRISLFLAAFFMFFIVPLGNVSAYQLTDPEYESTIHSFVAEGRPLVKSYQDWMDAHPDKFTQGEFQNRLLWGGPKGGDPGATQYLQLGFGTYKADGSTPIAAGEFNPYGYQYTADIYAAYKQWRETGVQPPHNMVGYNAGAGTDTGTRSIAGNRTVLQESFATPASESGQSYKNFIDAIVAFRAQLLQSNQTELKYREDSPEKSKLINGLSSIISQLDQLKNLPDRGNERSSSSVQAQGVENTNFYTPNAQDPLYNIYNKYDSFDAYRRSSDFNPQDATGLEYRYQTTGKGPAPEGGWKSRFVKDKGILTPDGEFNTNYLNQWSSLPATGVNSATNQLR